MEMNGRHNRSGLLAVKCGINFPWFEYQGLVNQNLGPEYTKQNNFDDNVYWIDEIWDLVYFFKSIKERKINLIDYARPYYNKHIFSVLDWRDVKPFLKRISNGISKS